MPRLGSNSVTFDCEKCGACCCNAASNRHEGYEGYIEIDDARSRLVADAGLRRKYVREVDGAAHLRLVDNRCAALRGAIGRRAWCVVYAHRPRACRRVQPGDGDCLRARREQGVSADGSG